MHTEHTGEWEAGICECCSSGACVFFTAALGCPCCVQACALSTMDGSSFLFNFCCFNLPFTRIYVRTAYGIEGAPGWDLCIALCPCTCLCSACQVYTQVRHRGKPANHPPINQALVNPHVCPENFRHSVCADPCGMIMTTLTSPCTSASLGAQVTGLPFWVHLLCGSFYINRHVIKKNFGVPTDMKQSCFQPLCCRVFVHVIPVCGTVACCIYTAQSLENDRLLIAHAIATGAPRRMLDTEVEIELPSVVVGQPGS